MVQEDLMQIASRIKELREIHGVSMETLAREFAVDPALYRSYESGEADIPISILSRIANRFGVELTSLLTGEEPRLHTYCLTRKGEGVSVQRRKAYKYRSLAHNFVHKKAEPFLVTVEPGPDDAEVSYNSHPGQEFNYVLEGTLKVVLDGREIIMGEGDSLFFDANVNHGMQAVNGKTAKFLAVIF